MSTNPPNTLQAINVPFSASPNAHLKMAVGACRLLVKPGNKTNWVTGTYFDPSGTLPFKLAQQDDTVLLTQEFNLTDATYRFETPPTFDLTLGNAKPYALTIETGASEALTDLSGLPLTRLEINHGAGKVEINFSAPNPEPMSFLKLSSGAGSTEFRNLANSNAAELKIEGGAASYKLDFGGTLRRDMHVKIDAAVSGVEITIPATTAARIVPNTVMGGLEIDDGLLKQGGAFVTLAAPSNQTPRLTIEAQVTMGSLTIRLGNK